MYKIVAMDNLTLKQPFFATTFILIPPVILQFLWHCEVYWVFQFKIFKKWYSLYISYDLLNLDHSM